MSTLSQFMALESQARLYIIKLRNCLNKNIYLPYISPNITSAPSTYLLYNSLVRIAIKTLFRVLFSSLYLQICIFITVFPFLVWLWDNPNRKYNFKMSKQCDVCIVWLWKCQKSILQVKPSECTYTRDFDVISATGVSYWPSVERDTRVRVNPIFWKNSK